MRISQQQKMKRTGKPGELGRSNSHKLSVAGRLANKSGNGGNALPTCSELMLPHSNSDAQSDDSMDHYSSATPPVSVVPKSSSTTTKRSSFVEIRNGESRDEFLQRGIITIGHDTRDNNVIGAALLERLDRIETAFVAMKKSDGDADEDFMQMLPLNSMYDFDIFNDLKSKSMSQRLKTHLIGIGGNSPRTIVRSIARRLMTNELGKSFSWFGHRNNKKLADTNIGKVIIAASVRNTPLITEADVKSTMIDMLRHCKDKRRTVPVL
ncbi:hypothetical protein GHT06_006296 [Daphnia sinensis]|uniref:DUF4806 domain-containing protein n=1 Tax=Daphnia sinensis TaxID=1820382 RepID=A0AAD5PPJ8_9CRUS|nr:hypothetical protein GHT06_005479 [Daphnia sinensis]KAI9550601.1 hypothetical protein GHT06_006296 [Daphnia sinensis]